MHVHQRGVLIKKSNIPNNIEFKSNRYTIYEGVCPKCGTKRIIELSYKPSKIVCMKCLEFIYSIDLAERRL